MQGLTTKQASEDSTPLQVTGKNRNHAPFSAIVLCAVAGCMPLVVCGGRSTAKKSNVTACELESMLYDFVKKIQCGDKNL